MTENAESAPSGLLTRLQQRYQKSHGDLSKKIMKSINGRRVFDSWLEIFLAEMFGTGFLMYFGCMGLFADAGKLARASAVQAGFSFGFIVTAVVVAFGHISRAHINPSVTICAYLLGIISPLTILVYLAGQILGALLGMYLLKISVKASLYAAYNEAAAPCGFCSTQIHPDLNVMQGFLIEFLATSVLIYVVCSVWDPRNEKVNDSVALKIGVLIMTLSMVVGPFTGNSLNPARSLGPAVVNNGWKDHWVYWVAPLLSSVVTTLFYKYIFMSGLNREADGTGNSEQEKGMLKSEAGETSPRRSTNQV